MTSPIVILTGAGISQESGIRTFRDANGLWENQRIEDVASPEGFAKNPSRVHEFYNQRRKQLLSSEVKPNEAHHALARLENQWKGSILLVTQNVDNLHERAGSKKLLHMHGELLKTRCMRCHGVFEHLDDLNETAVCTQCVRPATLRPHIVWFGETPLFMDEILTALQNCEIFMSIGTSGQVYPAAGFASRVPEKCFRMEINTAETEISDLFDEHWVGPASREVSKAVEWLLSRKNPCYT